MEDDPTKGQALAALFVIEQLLLMLILTSKLESSEAHALIAGAATSLAQYRDQRGLGEQQTELLESALLRVEELGNRLGSVFPKPESMV